MSLFDPPSDDSDGESVVDAGKSKKSASRNKKNSRKKNGKLYFQYLHLSSETQKLNSESEMAP